ncbi:RsmB/NOP family class I SAM-dependent RNA methyltransferase [Pseudothioclava arenosa]|uniref:SAM-dependent methyltransferase n=1 Tax=Pseudothioclava arenosa TaxID=1795308 RepID=A0A2A4CS11_9RHOB|nr:RsmB/NOP family class I SAM-dependent RNA methyltransferase [Pseudothioclava arenosa]PCD76939.1 SAM-dependent methyltransferase [Pseudothioclava arenosa]
MTPAARLSAAIEILDRVLAGAPAERELTNWARANRFAGSGDRAAIRDHVYDVLRCRGSFAALGGALTGRGLMLGLLRAQGVAPEGLFTGERFAPAPLSEAELAAQSAPVSADLDSADWPEWMRPCLLAELGGDYPAVSAAMRARAPVWLRVNTLRATRAEAQQNLKAEGFTTRAHATVATALEATQGARKIQSSAAYRDGLIELQDASSQAAIAALTEALPAPQGTVLDYCAGGGGKALALAAAWPQARILAHDVDAARMRDIAPRAERAGLRIETRAPGRPGGDHALVVVDAPCSGSGTWRRTPEAKWRLTQERLDALVALQAEILRKAAALVAPGGALAYMTCSLFEVENRLQINEFGASEGWIARFDQRWLPGPDGDGFYLALLDRA